jgi:hypothetical protein
MSLTLRSDVLSKLSRKQQDFAWAICHYSDTSHSSASVHAYPETEIFSLCVELEGLGVMERIFEETGHVVFGVKDDLVVLEFPDCCEDDEDYDN